MASLVQKTAKGYKYWYIVESRRVNGKPRPIRNNLTAGATYLLGAIGRSCMSYRVLYAKLNEFEQDLHQHIHLENNILFPKAVEMETELMG